MRQCRAEVLDPNEINIAHICSRTVRRCFLFGDDPVSGNNFDHRKVWIEDHLQHFAACFGIDLLGFAILSNHFHLILRTRPDIVKSWDDEEVARRWLLICPHRKDNHGKALKPTDAEIGTISNCPVRLAEIRSRLSNISWWMRLLCQRVAQRANQEDQENGRFFQDRYKAVRLLDEASILACSAYVDLNIIRAGIAETIEQSEHTSVQKRIDSWRERNNQEETSSKSPRPKVESIRENPDSFLSPLTIDEQRDPIGLCVSQTGARCSDKGYLPISQSDYFQLLDWTARQSVAGKSGTTPAAVAPVLKRLGLAPTAWSELVNDFGKLFIHVAGHPEIIDATRSHRTQRRFHVRQRLREILAPLA
jgi:hypothetical protein